MRTFEPLAVEMTQVPMEPVMPVTVPPEVQEPVTALGFGVVWVAAGR